MNEEHKRKRGIANVSGGQDHEGPVTKKLAASATKTSAKEDQQPWSLDLHCEFVKAIYKMGVKQCSPSVILENMVSKDKSGLTTERIKSHLQKYRKRQSKSEDEFLDSYQSWLDRHTHNNAVVPFLPPNRNTNLMCGESAAYLTYMTLFQSDKNQSNVAVTNNNNHGLVVDAYPNTPQQQPQIDNNNTGPAALQLPRLTPQEKQTPLGECMAYVAGMLRSMSNHVAHERARRSFPQPQHYVPMDPSTTVISNKRPPPEL